jgi:hypothetical protein
MCKTQKSRILIEHSAKQAHFSLIFLKKSMRSAITYIYLRFSRFSHGEKTESVKSRRQDSRRLRENDKQKRLYRNS